MHETSTLHFDLSHLSPDQRFTLHAGSGRYELTPHTRHTLARARRTNAALALIPDHQVTHFSGPVRMSAAAPQLLWVTAPKRNPDDLLDRLVLTSIHIPRRYRVAGLAQRRRLRGASLPVPPKLAAYGLAAGGTPPGNLPPDEVLVDVDDINTAHDAAYSLVFHHPELLALQGTPAEQIVDTIKTARGIDDLAQSIYSQAQNHEKNPSQPNWVISKPGTDWRTGQPTNPVYSWSQETLASLSAPLSDTLQQTKDDLTLEKQCWTVQQGITQVPMTSALAALSSADEGAGAAATYTVKEVTPQSGVEHDFSYDPGTKTATVSLKNHYVRWLKVCVDLYAPGGEQVGSTQVLGCQSPVDTIMAVPLDPDWSDFPFTFDDKASLAVVSFGGLGQAPFNWLYDGDGIVLTSVFNFAIPTMFIGIGVAVDQSSVWSTLEKSVASKVLAALEASDEGPIATAVGTGSAGLTDVLYAVANCAGSLLLAALTSKGCEELQAYIASALGEGAAEKAEPFLGWIADAIGAAADVASMVETSVEVARSPATMTLDIERTMDVQVTVLGDPEHQGQFPGIAKRYAISVTYDDGPVHNYYAQMPDTTQPGPIEHTFTGLPAGGNITVLASFYADSGWMAGHGISAPMAAQPNKDGTLVVPDLAIKENKVPLTVATTYSLKQKLGYQGGNRLWLAPPAIAAPTATVSDLDGSDVGNNLKYLGQLTLNEHESALGYSWQASGQNVPLDPGNKQPYTGQMFTYQSIDDQDAGSGLVFPGYGYTPMPCLAFPPPTMANPLADGFLLEPDDSGDSMLLRAISLQPGQPVIASPGQSFGRFTFPQDDLALHPAGYAVALNNSTCKLQVVRLAAATADASAPAATILSGQGNRPGLLNSPVAVSCALDRIVVLQTSDDYPQGCVCAFDVKGNPVNCFGGNAASVAGLHPEGSANVQLVDLSVEPAGYLYVLKYLSPSSGQVLAGDYRLDIYNPDGTFLTQVVGIAAARLHVDLWRNLFTLNYEILEGSGRTEPSVAEWIPSTPGA